MGLKVVFQLGIIFQKYAAFKGGETMRVKVRSV